MSILGIANASLGIANASCWPQIGWRIAGRPATHTAIRPRRGRSRRPRDLRQPQPGLDYEAQLRSRADEGSALGNSEDQALIPQRLNRSPGRIPGDFVLLGQGGLRWQRRKVAKFP